MFNAGTVKPGSKVWIPVNTFDSNDPSASVTATNWANTDCHVHKDGGTTQRASSAGETLSLNFDTITGNHLLEIDTADNTTAGFYAAGATYHVRIEGVTVDAGTINAWIGTFRIGYEGAILNTTIATLASQTSFTLTVGSADADAYNGCIAIIHDVASAVQVAIGIVSDYAVTTKTITLAADPGIFTMAAGDNISLLPPALLPTVAGRTLDVTATGAAGIDWGNVENKTTANDLSGTDIQLCDTVTTNSDMRGTDSAATAVALATAQTDLDTITGADGVTLATAQALYAPAKVGAAMTLTSAYDFAKGTAAMTESYAADGAAPTPAQSLFMIQQILTEFAISSTTLTMKKLDGSTTAATFTLSDATNPTSITRAT